MDENSAAFGKIKEGYLKFKNEKEVQDIILGFFIEYLEASKYKIDFFSGCCDSIKYDFIANPIIKDKIRTNVLNYLNDTSCITSSDANYIFKTYKKDQEVFNLLIQKVIIALHKYPFVYSNLYSGITSKPEVKRAFLNSVADALSNNRIKWSKFADKFSYLPSEVLDKIEYDYKNQLRDSWAEVLKKDRVSE
jgi:hypothetical protein